MPVNVLPGLEFCARKIAAKLLLLEGSAKDKLQLSYGHDLLLLTAFFTVVWCFVLASLGVIGLVSGALLGQLMN